MNLSSLRANQIAQKRWRLGGDELPQPKVLSRKRAQTPKSVKVILFAGVFALGLSTFLPQYMQGRDLQGELTRLQGEKAQLELELQQVEGERVVVQTDEFVERMAREKLGLVRKGEVQVIQVVPGDSRPLKVNNDPSAYAVH